MTTPRSFCAARMRSTCWHTSTRNACPPRYASVHYSAVDAPQTCGTVWSTPSTCWSRGATEYHESAGWKPCLWLSRVFFDWLHGPVFTGPSVLLAMSQGPNLQEYGNGFEVQALLLSTGTVEFRLIKTRELGWNQKRPFKWTLSFKYLCLLYKYAAILLRWSLTAMLAFAVDIEVASVGQGDVV